MPKAERKSNHVNNTSENELQDDSNLPQESSTDDEVVLQSPQFSLQQVKCKQCNKYICHIYVKGFMINEPLV